MEFMIVFRQMIVLLAMILTGFIVYRRKWISGQTYSTLSKLVVSVFNPILIISSVTGKTFNSDGVIFWQNLLLTVFSCIALFVGCLLFHLLAHPSKIEGPFYQMLILFPNCGFMGIPIVATVLGTEYVIFVSIYMLFYNILLYSYGVYLAQKSNQSQGLENIKTMTFAELVRTIFFNPGVVASGIAVLLFFTGIPLPNWVDSYCSYMGNVSIPMAMVLIGCSIAATNIKSMLKSKRIYIYLLIRMLLIPILTIFVLYMTPFESEIVQICVTMLALPAGSLIVLVAEEYGGDSSCVAQGTIMSTIVSIITIPIVYLFM